MTLTSARAAAPVLALTVGALGLRVIQLDRLPLWLDEGISLLLVTNRSFSDWRADVHPPLYYALLLPWAQLSTSDVWLRLLSAVLGALTVPAVYALGARLLGRASGLWAAAFLTVTWFHVWYSREARMYPLLVLAFTLALWGLVAGARDGRVAGWVVHVLGGAMLAWSHGIGVCYVAVLAVVGLTISREDGHRWSWRPWLVANTAIVLLFAPWAPVVAKNVPEVSTSFWLRSIAPEPPVLTTIHQFTVAPIHPPGLLLRSRLGLDVSPTLGDGLWIVPILGVLALAVALSARDRRPTVRFLLLAYLAPIGLFTALSLMVRPILIPRILLPVVVPLVLLLAAGVGAVPWRRVRVATGTLIGLVLLMGTAYGLHRDAGETEGWREASRYLQAEARPGDALLFLSSQLTRPRESAKARALATTEMLLLRYDDTGR
ncbi:MAG TPA: glycosyltransferase family 39 protein, partial [Candidatus Limnocylindrales bacterium]|nr:glycosyltransferase family 39 protein [Candidatus Limnocylindrales bacterium]